MFVPSDTDRTSTPSWMASSKALRMSAEEHCPLGDVPADLVHRQASPVSSAADEPGGKGFEAGVGGEGAGGDGGGMGPVADGVPGGEEVWGVGGVEGLVVVGEEAVDMNHFAPMSLRLQADVALNCSPETHQPFHWEGIGVRPESLKTEDSGHVPVRVKFGQNPKIMTLHNSFLFFFAIELYFFIYI